MTLRNVTGLDLSLTSTGLVTLSAYPTDLGAAGVVLRADVLTSRKEVAEGAEVADRMERLREILAAIRTHMAYWPGTVLWVLEGYAYRSLQLADLAELGGVVKWWLYVERQRILVVPPARLKKFCTGKGNAAKDEMRLAVYKRWGFEHASHDVVDAYALARLGLAVLGLDEGLTREQREVAEELGKQLEGSERT